MASHQCPDIEWREIGFLAEAFTQFSRLKIVDLDYYHNDDIASGDPFHRFAIVAQKWQAVYAATMAPKIRSRKTPSTAHISHFKLCRPQTRSSKGSS